MKSKNLTYINTNSHEEWLELRRKSIGGSDASTILGVNKYSSLYSLWLDKKGLAKETEETEAMRQGTDLEDYVAKRFCEETGKKVRRKSQTIINPDYPHSHANVDRWVVGENAGLECKTTNSLNLRKFDAGEFPPQYYAQCLHYMAITGADKFYLAVLIFGKDFKVFEIERDEEAITNLMKAEENFWYYVENDVPPPVDGSDATGNAIDNLYVNPVHESTDLSLVADAIDNWTKLKAKRREIDSELKKYEQIIKLALGYADEGNSNGYRVTWKEQVRHSFDSKRFIKDHPELYEKYVKESRYRVLKVKNLTD